MQTQLPGKPKPLPFKQLVCLHSACLNFSGIFCELCYFGLILFFFINWWQLPPVRDKIDMAIRLFSALKSEAQFLRPVIQEATISLAFAYKVTQYFSVVIRQGVHFLAHRLCWLIGEELVYNNKASPSMLFANPEMILAMWLFEELFSRRISDDNPVWETFNSCIVFSYFKSVSSSKWDNYCNNRSMYL